MFVHVEEWSILPGAQDLRSVPQSSPARYRQLAVMQPVPRLWCHRVGSSRRAQRALGTHGGLHATPLPYDRWCQTQRPCGVKCHLHWNGVLPPGPERPRCPLRSQFRQAAPSSAGGFGELQDLGLAYGPGNSRDRAQDAGMHVDALGKRRGKRVLPRAGVPGRHSFCKASV